MIDNSKHNEIVNEYFEWMYHLVCNEEKYNKLSYRKLLYFLHSVSFIPRLEMDDNRRIDGIDFRYRFGYENGYSDEYISRYLDTRECSVLEMMIALAFRVEENITSNYMYGNRTGQWFWMMIVNLGLGQMDDSKFDKNNCIYVINQFLQRKYSKNGRGGLFVLERPKGDMRNVDIWCQFMWYLDENMKEEIYG